MIRRIWNKWGWVKYNVYKWTTANIKRGKLRILSFNWALTVNSEVELNLLVQTWVCRHKLDSTVNCNDISLSIWIKALMGQYTRIYCWNDVSFNYTCCWWYCIKWSPPVCCCRWDLYILLPAIRNTCGRNNCCISFWTSYLNYYFGAVPVDMSLMYSFSFDINVEFIDSNYIFCDSYCHARSWASWSPNKTWRSVKTSIIVIGVQNVLQYFAIKVCCESWKGEVLSWLCVPYNHYLRWSSNCSYRKRGVLIDSQSWSRVTTFELQNIWKFILEASFYCNQENEWYDWDFVWISSSSMVNMSLWVMRINASSH